MTRLSAFVRNAPKLFYVLAVVDFVKNALALTEFFQSGRFAGMDYGTDIKIALFRILLSALVYAAQWIAYGVFASLLIAIFDEVALRRSHATEAEDA